LVLCVSTGAKEWKGRDEREQSRNIKMNIGESLNGRISAVK
jgi:hypothetical protein